MKKQGLIVTIKEIRKLSDELEIIGLKFPYEKLLDRKFQVNIVNKEGLSDTWELQGKNK